MHCRVCQKNFEGSLQCWTPDGTGRQAASPSTKRLGSSNCLHSNLESLSSTMANSSPATVARRGARTSHAACRTIACRVTPASSAAATLQVLRVRLENGGVHVGHLVKHLLLARVEDLLGPVPPYGQELAQQGPAGSRPGAARTPTVPSLRERALRHW